MAAVGSTTSIINLLTNMFVGLSVGANVLVANLYCSGKRKDTQRLHKITLTAQICVIATGVVMGNAVVLFGRPLLSIYTSTPAIMYNA